MKGTMATKALLFSLSVVGLASVEGQRGLRAEDENRAPLAHHRGLMGKGKSSSKKSGSSSRSSGGSGGGGGGGGGGTTDPVRFPLIQNFLCEIFEQVGNAANNPLSDLACRTNSCNDGCCRLVDRAFLTCDVRNLFPFSPCVCNGLTGNRQDGVGGDGVPLLPFSEAPTPAPTKSVPPTMTPTTSPAPTMTPVPTTSPSYSPTTMPVNRAIPGLDPAVQDTNAVACLNGHPSWSFITAGSGLIKCRDWQGCGEGECCKLDFCVCQPIAADRYNELCVPPPVNG